MHPFRENQITSLTITDSSAFLLSRRGLMKGPTRIFWNLLMKRWFLFQIQSSVALKRIKIHLLWSWCPLLYFNLTPMRCMWWMLGSSCTCVGSNGLFQNLLFLPCLSWALCRQDSSVWLFLVSILSFLSQQSWNYKYFLKSASSFFFLVAFLYCTDSEEVMGSLIPA